MSYTHSIPPRKPVPPRQVTTWQDPWPDSPISEAFRHELFLRESNPDGYRAYNSGGGGLGAWGRYQMRQRALVAGGVLDDMPRTPEELDQFREQFLDDPEAQERAFAQYMRGEQEYLSMPSRGYRDIDQIVTSGDGNFTITEGGLLAAAHRVGTPRLRDYLWHLADHGWVSDLDTFPSGRRPDFEAAERRLREFQTIPYSKPRPIPPHRPL